MKSWGMSSSDALREPFHRRGGSFTHPVPSYLIRLPDPEEMSTIGMSIEGEDPSYKRLGCRC
jgi:hypothetical protein